MVVPGCLKLTSRFVEKIVYFHLLIWNEHKCSMRLHYLLSRIIFLDRLTSI